MHKKKRVSDADFDLIVKIMDRIAAEFPHIERSALAVGLIDVHTHCPLKLQAMLGWEHLQDVTHDIGGILHEWDAEKKEFKNCFSPRFAAETRRSHDGP